MTELISVIVTTYNWESALAAVLRSLAAQTDRNFEVIVADDGSGPQTAALVEAAKPTLGRRLVHVWHEDRGFRAGEIRNRAVLEARGDYVIFLDGDCIVRPDFVASHRRLSRPGKFVTGNRILLSRDLSAKVLNDDLVPERWDGKRWLAERWRGGVNRLAALLSLPLGPLRGLRARAWRGARSCNMAVWRRDLIRVDGFDAEYSGWGKEDSDIIVRLLHAGVTRRDGTFATGVIHLWHAEADRSALPENERKLAQLLASNVVRARRGMSALSAVTQIPAEAVAPFADKDARSVASTEDRAGRIALPLRPRILVIALRRLGDVLLTTPVTASLRRAFPDATIDVLVFADTAGIVQGNPDIDNIVSMPARRTVAQSLKLVWRLWRRYDLAVSTQSGDRPTFFALIAGRRAVAPVEARFSGRIKRSLLSRSVNYQPGVHRVEEMLRLVDALGLARVPRVTAPRAPDRPLMPQGRYAVIHAAPMFRYKQWSVAGWRALAEAIVARGLTVIATGGPAAEERAYLDRIWAGSGVPVTRLDGTLDWSQLTGLLAKADVYVGPDTSVTHLAAASGCATVALFGPTDPRLWGPWPVDGLDRMWAATGKIQERGNVWLVQNAYPCTPCQLEGCERRLESHSQCLDDLPARQVIAALDQVLASKR